MKVKSVRYNWHQVGSISDRAGAGEYYQYVVVGEKGVVSISEFCNQMEIYSYLVYYDDGTIMRILNPNLVHYFPNNIEID